mgnify:CR=1 FL=1
MRKQRTENSPLTTFASKSGKGFTLVETLLAVSLLCVAITAPMLLTVQALSSAYYARDNVIAYNLAQEGIEIVHALRDNRILEIAQTSGSSSNDLFGDIPVNTAFAVDGRNDRVYTNNVNPLRDQNGLYTYGGGTPTPFSRTLVACYIQSNGSCSSNPTDEMRVTVTISWRTASYAPRSFTISENLYRWVIDGSGV